MKLNYEIRVCCDSCPCRGENDITSYCNLKYDIIAGWDVSHAYHDTSINCKLKSVIYEGGVFTPIKDTSYISVHPESR